MKFFVKFVSFALALIMLSVCVSCGGEKGQEEQQVTSQKVYNTAFQQATSAIPNSTTLPTEETTAQTDVTEFVLPSTVKRTGKRVITPQTVPMRNISSAKLLGEMKAGITLGDSFTAYGLGESNEVEKYETYFKNPKVTKELIDAYATAGFSAVRIPVSWTDHIDSSGVIDVAWLQRVEEVVGYVIDSGMYCILNSQNDQSWLTTNSENFNETKAKFSALWTSIATHFEAFNDHLIFESVGDILKAENDKSEPSASDIKNANVINQTFVDAVRATGKNNQKRHLIVSTYGAFVGSASLDGFTVPKDSAKNRLIAKVNVYVPSQFCLNESEDNLWGTAEDKAYLENVLGMINLRFSTLEIPVIIGEFGVVDKGNVSARAAYAKYFVSTAYNYYMVCFWNDNGNTMKLFNRNTAQIIHQNIVNSIISAAK